MRSDQTSAFSQKSLVRQFGPTPTGLQGITLSEYPYANGIRFSGQLFFVPVGTPDTRPPIHRWVHEPHMASSPGRGERISQRGLTVIASICRPLRDSLVCLGHSPTVETVGECRVSLTGQRAGVSQGRRVALSVTLELPVSACLGRRKNREWRSVGRLPTGESQPSSVPPDSYASSLTNLCAAATLA